MKIMLSHSAPANEGHEWIQDFSDMDSIVENSEATEIIVDSFLSSFGYQNIGSIVSKIVSKLRMGGRLVIYENDIDLLSHQYSKSGMDIQDINNLLFSDTPAIACVLNTETITDLLEQMGLQIEERLINNDTMQSIITARRKNNEN